MFRRADTDLWSWVMPWLWRSFLFSFSEKVLILLLKVTIFEYCWKICWKITLVVTVSASRHGSILDFFWYYLVKWCRNWKKIYTFNHTFSCNDFLLLFKYFLLNDLLAFVDKPYAVQFSAYFNFIQSFSIITRNRYGRKIDNCRLKSKRFPGENK